MNEVFFDKVGTKEDPVWVFRHCFNKLCSSNEFTQHLKRLLEDGHMAGDLNWSIQRWSEEVGKQFNVDKFDGYMAFVGKDEHGYGEAEEFYSFLSTDKFHIYLNSVMDWYSERHPKTTQEIQQQKKMLI